MFLGNRGILHDENKRIIRQSRGNMWLICQLEFIGRKQELVHPKRYTQLFFLGEAVALAAGRAATVAKVQRGLHRGGERSYR
jgi:hypothetical protein